MKKSLLILPLLFLSACGEKNKPKENNYYKEIQVYTPTPKREASANMLDDDFAYAGRKVHNITFQKPKNNKIKIINKDNFQAHKNAEKLKNTPYISPKKLDKNNKTNSQNNNSEENKRISFFDVKDHSSESDCWIVVNKTVYDITKYLPYYPEGPLTLIRYCGKNASAQFKNLPGSFSKTLKTLERYKKGDLK